MPASDQIIFPRPGPSAALIRPNQPKFAHRSGGGGVLPEIGQMRPEPRRNRLQSGRNLVNVGPNLGDFCRKLVGTGRQVDRFGPKFANVGRSLVKFGRARPECDGAWPKFGRPRQTWARHGQTLARKGPTPVKSAKHGRTRPDSGRIWPTPAQTWPEAAQLGSKSAGTRPSPCQIGRPPTIGQRSAMCAPSGFREDSCATWRRKNAKDTSQVRAEGNEGFWAYEHAHCFGAMGASCRRDNKCCGGLPKWPP